MSINFPTSLDTLINPTATDTVTSPSHADQHANANDAIEALEAKVGINSSAVTTSHDYKLSGVIGSDKAVSKTGTETLTNKTLTSPVIATIVNTGTLTLPTSTDTLVGKATTDTLTNKTLTSPTITNASSTGTNSGTETLANKTLTTPTIASFVNANHTHQDAAGGGQLVATTVFASGTVPTARLGSGTANSTTYLRGDQTWQTLGVPVFKTGYTTHDMSTTGAQNIAHGLGVTPKLVRITARVATTTASSIGYGESSGSYDASSQAVVLNAFDALNSGSTNGGNSTVSADASNIVWLYTDITGVKYATAVCSIDSTNITLTWSKNSTPTGTAYLLWEAIG